MCIILRAEGNKALRNNVVDNVIKWIYFFHFEALDVS